MPEIAARQAYLDAKGDLCDCGTFGGRIHNVREHGQRDETAAGRYCLRCFRRVYWVRTANGDVFAVSHDGKRWCQ